MPPAHRAAFVPRFLFSAFLLFSFLCFTEVPPPGIDFTPSPSEFLAAYLIGALFVFALIAILRQDSHQLPSPYICALPAIAGFALAFTYHAAHFGISLQVTAGAFLIGASSALLALQWICMFSQLNESSSAITVTALFLAAFSLKCLLSPFLGGSLNLAVLGACVLASAVPLEPLMRSRKPKSELDADTSFGASRTLTLLNVPEFLIPFIGCGLCCLVWGLMWGRVGSDEGLTPFTTLSTTLQVYGAAALTGLGLLALLQRGLIDKIRTTATTLGVALLLLSWLLMLPRAPWSGALSSLATGIGFSLVLISFWVSLNRACAASEQPLRLSAIVLGLLALVIFLSAWCAPAIDANLREIITPGASTIFLLLAPLAITKANKQLRSSRSNGAPECNKEDSFALFAESHSLSPGKPRSSLFSSKDFPPATSPTRSFSRSTRSKPM